MIPPGKTTLARMQTAALNEAERIEIIEDGWVKFGQLKEPRREQVSLRDDFAGIVRMIDAIESDAELLKLLQKAIQRITAPVAAEIPETEIVPEGEEAA